MDIVRTGTGTFPLRCGELLRIRAWCELTIRCIRLVENGSESSFAELDKT